MKEQKIYHVTVVEKTEKLHEGSGVIYGIYRHVLFDKKVSAVTPRSAEQKALANITANPDNLEVKIDEVNFPC